MSSSFGVEDVPVPTIVLFHLLYRAEDSLAGDATMSRVRNFRSGKSTHIIKKKTVLNLLFQPDVSDFASVLVLSRVNPGSPAKCGLWGTLQLQKPPPKEKFTSRSKGSLCTTKPHRCFSYIFTIFDRYKKGKTLTKEQ